MYLIFPFFKKKEGGKEEEGYIEVVPTQKTEEVKIWVRVFTIKDTSDIKAVTDTLREGNTIVILDMRNFKQNKDVLEFKKVVNRVKSVVEAIGGDIVGVSGGDWIIATPSFAKIWRGQQQTETQSQI